MVRHLAHSVNRRSEAALPPDVRKGSAFPAVVLILIPQAARLSLAACDKGLRRATESQRLSAHQAAKPR